MTHQDHPIDRFAHERSGFTLIELLVVIAVIAILAALIFPVASRIQAKAKASASVANLRSIGAGVPLYIAENRQKFPPAWNQSETEGNQTRAFTYAQYLEPYVHGVSPFDYSPSNITPSRMPGNVYVSPAATQEPNFVDWGFPTTVTANPAICTDVTPPPPGSGRSPNPPVSVFAVKRPSEVIMFIDGCQNPNNHWQANASFYSVSEAYSNSNNGIDNPINIGPNEDSSNGNGWIRYINNVATALMVDGSVRTFRIGTITKANVYIGAR